MGFIKSNTKMKWVLSLVLVIALTGCAEANIEPVSKNADSTTATTATATAAPAASEAPKVEVYKIGETIKYDNLEITLNDVKDSTGDDFIKPAEGNVYKIVDITVENKGDTEEVISSMMHFEMVDDGGYTYNVAITTAVKNQLDGSVGAGRKLSGQIAYEVPTDVKGLELIFKDPIKTGEVIWKVK
ncbi:DUF4352 domain-containing protein [Paenibacillus sp. GSMTC-2017]|uniref:DUF4352 domain-containing protein n=1 Tax=Paenibacillus sp. GSMTC-2017 TaxID=2794350 RepID=UPI0018D79FE8|nr:DUF4352 domain-containing protein [Paenibacillus sp. GSMTC-2017]MBH5317090.1 DUF4352 domain-containing protein [Paenibacillus sp. GSMTC-2017]